jgi:hypothetical protein
MHHFAIWLALSGIIEPPSRRLDMGDGSGWAGFLDARKGRETMRRWINFFSALKT